jgi:tetratricopeptide (TPR) repeat protein
MYKPKKPEKLLLIFSLTGMAGSFFVLIPWIRSGIIAFAEAYIVHRSLNYDVWNQYIVEMSFAGLLICGILMICAILLGFQQAVTHAHEVAPVDRFQKEGEVVDFKTGEKNLPGERIRFSHFAKILYRIVLRFILACRNTIKKLCPEKTGIHDIIFNGIAFSAVFVLIGFIAVATKSSEFEATKAEVFITFLLFGLAVAIVFFVIGLICKIIDTKKDLQLLTFFNKFCTALALLFLIITVFWPETYGVFDGRSQEVDYSLSVVIKSLWRYFAALVIAGFIVLFLKTWFKFISPAICIIAVICFMAAPVKIIIDESHLAGENLNLLSKNKNIIFIIWDAAVGKVVEHIFNEDPQLAENFKDFVLYPNAVTPYIFTGIAMPSVAGGIPASRKFESHDEILEAVKEASIFRTAKAAGFKNNAVTTGTWWGSMNDVEHYDLPFTKKRERQPLYDRLADILYKTSFRVLPVYITSFISRNSDQFENLLAQYPRKTEEVRLVPFLLENIGIGYEQPVFLAHHNEITHIPYLVTPNGEFFNDATILSDSEFAIRIMSRFLNRLKELGLYDNTLIVFSSDHGQDLERRAEVSYLTRRYNEFKNQLPQSYRTFGNSIATTVKYNPFILIKYPHVQQNGLIVNGNPVSTVYLHRLFEKALNASDWELGSLVGLFDQVQGPIEVRLMHVEDLNKVHENYYNFQLMQTFELANGLESLPKILDDLKPVSEKAKYFSYLKLFEGGDYAGTLAVLEKMEAADLDFSAGDLYCYAVSLHKMKRFDEALSFYSKAYDAGFNRYWIGYSRGSLYLEVNRIEEARADFLMAYSHDNLNSEALRVMLKQVGVEGF